VEDVPDATDAYHSVVAHGGKREGAGRPRLRLADIVAQGRFDPGSHRHRDLLEGDDLPAGVDAELRGCQDAFRRAPSASSRLFLARRFAQLLDSS
jgi:hypothetical protein